MRGFAPKVLFPLQFWNRGRTFGTVGLEHRCDPEQDVRQWEPRSPESLRRLRIAVTEVSEQFDKALLLGSLGGVVGLLIFLVCDADCPCLYRGAVRIALDGEFDGEDVLAPDAPNLEVWTGALRFSPSTVNK